ncbi:hypothetical protein BP5796_08774 [Coleophoma crateriformis]|uniref:Uncharacterized protein n=1 Tax=Coleophoma crateriformis TaxID=565419 RepID=A0A3D8R8J7_9HELO|nr:hypothetical protein BP5796_08774 [Coleophoma crateriformis]
MSTRKTPKEDKLRQGLILSSNRPEPGSVDIGHVTAGFNSNAIALKDLNLKVMAGQKLVICVKFLVLFSVNAISLPCLEIPSSSQVQAFGLNMGAVIVTALEKISYGTILRRMNDCHDI